MHILLGMPFGAKTHAWNEKRHWKINFELALYRLGFQMPYLTCMKKEVAKQTLRKQHVCCPATSCEEYWKTQKLNMGMSHRMHPRAINE